MKVIIIDDEIQTVRAIKHTINWEKIGIEEVFTAYNIAHAKDIISEGKPDIAVCDIEMPQGSGLELLQWIKLNYPDMESILLTCHAEFEFAKKAIQLGSFDYLIKPIPFEELEQAVFKAASQIVSARRLKTYSEYGEYWIKNQQALADNFWSDLVKGRLSGKPEEIAREAQKRNVDYQPDERYLPMLIIPKRLVTKLESWNPHLLDYALENIASELLLEAVNPNAVLILNGQLLAILPEAPDSQDEHQVRETCRKVIDACQQYLGCTVNCYVGDFIFGEQLSDMVNRLLDIDKNNVTMTGKIIGLNEWQTEGGSAYAALSAPHPQWTELLVNGDKEKLQHEMEHYICNLAAKGQLTFETLSLLQQDVLQFVYAFLEQQGVQAHRLFLDPESQELYQKATTAMEQMIRWVHYFIGKAADYSQEVAKSETVIDKVKKYIDTNLHNEIARDELAGLVFLNSDYLTRLFRKSTGRSIMEYITETRIKKAMILLKRSDLPIRTVAIQVGYDNLAYFSKLFKKATGYAPSEYRRQHQKSEME